MLNDVSFHALGMTGGSKFVTGGELEGTLHGGDLRGVPEPDGLIESGGSVKHVRDVGDLGGVPVPDGLVESGSFVKHALHVCDLVGVPR